MNREKGVETAARSVRILPSRNSRTILKRAHVARLRFQNGLPMNGFSV